jgi:TolA-binding protein
VKTLLLLPLMLLAAGSSPSEAGSGFFLGGMAEGMVNADELELQRRALEANDLDLYKAMELRRRIRALEKKLDEIEGKLDQIQKELAAAGAL